MPQYNHQHAVCVSHRSSYRISDTCRTQAAPGCLVWSIMYSSFYSIFSPSILSQTGNLTRHLPPGMYYHNIILVKHYSIYYTHLLPTGPYWFEARQNPVERCAAHAAVRLPGHDLVRFQPDRNFDRALVHSALPTLVKMHEWNRAHSR